MNTVKNIIYVSALVATYTMVSMHNLSQPGQTEAYLTNLGLRYLNEQDQKIFFNHLNQGNTKSLEFRSLVAIAINKEAHSKLPQVKRVKRTNSINPKNTKAYFIRPQSSLHNSI
jgi:hypothetical protein